jgi:hypothetical protein
MNNGTATRGDFNSQRDNLASRARASGSRRRGVKPERGSPMRTADHNPRWVHARWQMARGDGAKMARESAGIFRDWVVVSHRPRVGHRPVTSGFAAHDDPS